MEVREPNDVDFSAEAAEVKQVPTPTDCTLNANETTAVELPRVMGAELR